MGQLNAIVYLLVKNNDFICTQCRLDDITKDDKQKAFAIHDIASKDFEHLGAISNVMYCRDVTVYLNNLTLSEKCEFKPLAKSLRASGERWHIDYVMEEALDRRSETRYVIDKSAQIKLGLLNSLDVRVSDLSASGMKLLVPVGTDLQPELRYLCQTLK